MIQHPKDKVSIKGSKRSEIGAVVKATLYRVLEFWTSRECFLLHLGQAESYLTVNIDSAAVLPRCRWRAMKAAQDGRIRLGTMGMFIIDSFRFLDPIDGRDLGTKGLKEQIGGGGCYFAIGARMWLKPSQIQMIVDRGFDWNPQHQQALDRYDQTSDATSRRSMWYFRTRPDGTTKALNLYSGGQRGFEYLSPKIRLNPIDLLQCSPSTPPRLPDWIHLICSPQRALEAFEDMRSRCNENGQPFPQIIYEPIPDSCVPENLPDCMTALRSVAVFSPNHEEAASLLSFAPELEARLKATSTNKENELCSFIEHKLAAGFARLWAELHRDDKGLAEPGPIICIRSGPFGSIVGRVESGFTRVPAWHSSSTMAIDHHSDKVVDVTGAGNAFLGGFAAHLIRTEYESGVPDPINLVQAAMHGAVSASLVIEQLGLPDYRVEDGAELWNSRTVSSRLATL